jgi:hypothetical protein
MIALHGPATIFGSILEGQVAPPPQTEMNRFLAASQAGSDQRLIRSARAVAARRHFVLAAGANEGKVVLEA